MAIKYALLALLADGPNTASGLRQAFYDLFQDTQPLNMGQVSQTLTRLERDELVTTTGPITRPTGHQTIQYQLTAAGRAKLHDWQHAPVSRALSDRDELVLKLTFAATGPEQEFLDILDSQRAAVLTQLRKLNNEIKDLPPQRTGVRLLFERRIFDLEAEARWLDRIEALKPPVKGVES
jgi:hypothetical protein